MDFSLTAERISVKIGQKGQSVDKKKIEAKLRRLVEEFGVQPAEAERSVTNELAKEFNLTGIGSGSGAKTSSPAAPPRNSVPSGTTIPQRAPSRGLSFFMMCWTKRSSVAWT